MHTAAKKAGNSEGLLPASRQTADRREEETGRRAVTASGEPLCETAAHQDTATPHARREEYAGLAATRTGTQAGWPSGAPAAHRSDRGLGRKNSARRNAGEPNALPRRAPHRADEVDAGDVKGGEQ
jgi:hypothetical protein